MQKKKTLRVDKVVVQHLKILSGTVNLLTPNKHASNPPNNDDSSQKGSNNDETANMSQDTNAQFSDISAECRIPESPNLKKNTAKNLLDNSCNSQNSSFPSMNDNLIES